MHEMSEQTLYRYNNNRAAQVAGAIKNPFQEVIAGVFMQFQ